MTRPTAASVAGSVQLNAARHAANATTPSTANGPAGGRGGGGGGRGGARGVGGKGGVTPRTGAVRGGSQAERPPPSTSTEPRRVNLAAESLFDAVKTPHTMAPGPPRDTNGDVGEGEMGGGRTPPQAERRSAALVLRLAELRGWVQTCLQVELPPGDLPTLLEDGTVLMSLADVAMPGVAAPYTGASAARQLEAFATACRQLGVSEEEVLHAGELLPGPQRSAAALARGLAALAREASARKLLPPLSGAS